MRVRCWTCAKYAWFHNGKLMTKVGVLDEALLMILHYCGRRDDEMLVNMV